MVIELSGLHVGLEMYVFRSENVQRRVYNGRIIGFTQS